MKTSSKCLGKSVMTKNADKNLKDKKEKKPKSYKESGAELSGRGKDKRMEPSKKVTGQKKSPRPVREKL